MQTPGKLYYTIKEVAERFGVKTSKLRFYEQEFPTLKPKKNSAGDRVYTQEDIDHLGEIFELVEGKGLKLPAARAFLKQKSSRLDETRQHIQKLENLKAFLIQLRDEL